MLEVLTIMEGGHKRFPTFKKGERKKFYTVLRGQKVSDPRFSHFVAPLPIINAQSLTPSQESRGTHVPVAPSGVSG